MKHCHYPQKSQINTVWCQPIHLQHTYIANSKYKVTYCVDRSLFLLPRLFIKFRIFTLNEIHRGSRLNNLGTHNVLHLRIAMQRILNSEGRKRIGFLFYYTAVNIAYCCFDFWCVSCVLLIPTFRSLLLCCYSFVCWFVVKHTNIGYKSIKMLPQIRYMPKYDVDTILSCCCCVSMRLNRRMRL